MLHSVSEKRERGAVLFLKLPSRWQEEHLDKLGRLSRLWALSWPQCSLNNSFNCFLLHSWRRERYHITLPPIYPPPPTQHSHCLSGRMYWGKQENMIFCCLSGPIPVGLDVVYIVSFKSHKFYFTLGRFNYSQDAAYLTPSGDNSYLLKPQLLARSVNIHRNVVSGLSVADRSAVELLEEDYCTSRGRSVKSPGHERHSKCFLERTSDKRATAMYSGN